MRNPCANWAVPSPPSTVTWARHCPAWCATPTVTSAVPWSASWVPPTAPPPSNSAAPAGATLGSTRSQLQRVRWRLAGSTLERVYWSVLDQAVDSPPRVQKVLEGVSSVELRYLDDKGQWQEQWPPSLGDSDPAKARGRLPVAVELKLEHRHYGGLTRLYRLPEMGVEEQPSEGGTTPDDDKKPTPEPEPKPDAGKEKGA